MTISGTELNKILNLENKYRVRWHGDCNNCGRRDCLCGVDTLVPCPFCKAPESYIVNIPDYRYGGYRIYLCCPLCHMGFNPFVEYVTLAAKEKKLKPEPKFVNKLPGRGKRKK